MASNINPRLSIKQLVLSVQILPYVFWQFNGNLESLFLFCLIFDVSIVLSQQKSWGYVFLRIYRVFFRDVTIITLHNFSQTLKWVQISVCHVCLWRKQKKNENSIWGFHEQTIAERLGSKRNNRQPNIPIKPWNIVLYFIGTLHCT